MRLLCISDVHGQINELDQILSKEMPADLLVLAGDLTDRGSVDDARAIVALARQHTPTVIAVSGNCDSARIDRMLFDEGVGLHAASYRLRQTAIIGVSGIASRRPWHYRFSEQDYTRLLNMLSHELPVPERLFLVSHSPPYGLADRTFMGNKAGSRAIRDWVERRQPELVICGHIHEAQGTEAFGPTTVVNCGPAFKQRYAVVELGPGPPTVVIHRSRF